MSVASKRHSSVTAWRRCRPVTGAVTALALILVVGWHFADWGVTNAWTGAAEVADEDPKLCIERIAFPREHIPAKGCEGYFSTTPARALQEGLLFPEATSAPFCGAKEWARRLRAIEEHAEAEDNELGGGAVPIHFGIRVERQRGLSVSRLTGTLLGNREFSDWYAVTNEQGARALPESSLLDPAIYRPHSAIDAAEELRRREAILTRKGDVVCWTQDLLSHYVLGFHVIPSREFFHYVLDKFDIIATTERNPM